jgi:hypothetical protein
MNQQADFAVYSPDERLQLIVEVKNKNGATADWAAHMRRNLFVHSAVPNAPFFLLALPDRFYLWTHAPALPEATPPDYEIDATAIVAGYTDSPKLHLSEYSLELIVNSWLNNLINSDLTQETAGPHEKWLFDSGLYEAIKDGSVKTAAPV